MPNISNFYQDAYPATDQLQCITIYIPAGDEFKWLLAGLLRLPATESSYQDPDSEQAQGLADIWREGYDLTDWGGCMNNNELSEQARVTLWHKWSQVYVGNALQENIDALCVFSVFWRQNTAALGDSSYQDMSLGPGNYQCRVLAQKLSNNGKLTLLAANETTFYQEFIFTDADLYNASTLRNQVLTASFTLDERVDRLYIMCGAKNASSSGYAIPLTQIEIWREPDL